MVAKMRRIWSRFPGFIRRDFSRKVAALCLAAIVYETVLDRLNSDHEIKNVKLTVSVPAGYVLMDQVKPSVDIFVSGSTSTIKKLGATDFSSINLEVKPDQFTAGKPYELTVKPANIRAPIGVTVNSVIPEIVNIDLDKEIVRDVRVEPVYSEKKTKGFMVRGFTVLPEKVQVTGPSKLMRTIDVLRTEPVDLERMNRNFDSNPKVLLPNDSVKISPTTVLVKTEIGVDTGSRDFSGVPLFFLREPNKTYKAEFAELSDVTVSLEGPSEVLEKISSASLRAYVDLGNFNRPGEMDLPVMCGAVPPGVSVISIEPKTVKVKFSK